LSLSPNIQKQVVDEKFKKDFYKFLNFCSRKDFSCTPEGVAEMFDELKFYLRSHSLIENEEKFEKALCIELLQQQLPFCKCEDGNVGFFKPCAQIPLNIEFNSPLSLSEMSHVVVAYQGRYNCSFVDFLSPPSDLWFTNPSEHVSCHNMSSVVGPVVAMLLTMSCYSDTIIKRSHQDKIVVHIDSDESSLFPETLNEFLSLKNGRGKLADSNYFAVKLAHGEESTESGHDSVMQFLHDAKVGSLVVR
jgi:hypothetical protein